MAGSQDKLGRVRPPRVQIGYDVETNGAMEKKELPFVVGVMADLSGQPATALAPVKNRAFVDLNPDNFNEVLKKATPRLAYRVDNTLTGEGQLNVELKFNHMDDFSPANVAKQIAPMKSMLDTRAKLVELLSRMEGNDKMEALLADILANQDKAQEIVAALPPAQG